MKKIEFYTIVSNKQLTKDIYEMNLQGDGSWVTNPGQFINIKVSNKFLRRPISICDWSKDSLTIIYKVVGEGTSWLASLQAKDQIEALVGLGNGFSLDDKHLLLIGGGVGIPPIYGACKQLVKLGYKPTVILGYQSKADEFYFDKFHELTDKLYVSTNDGSLGLKGFVSDVMIKNGLCDMPYLTCGPLGMLKAIYKTSNCDGQISLEERMGCGFGACMGCSIETKNGYKRICKEGPVLRSEELLWTKD
ncbi:MAG: dihydroorotate dehydrogenase electron transfer subunit [Erysipelotrichaceae bacterium]|nr:dihydroorotate dehydrogenase electron transfer subunit [Erysipelotrichaceae bacterium]MDY5252662.1 dihydroorotate dehydrogenase electron transfer subunit [Erysipelotrichaceae bacterium]